MLRLFYVSTAAISFAPEALQKLQSDAAENNKRLAIGGHLVFNGMNFGQVLEGKHEVVHLLVDKIKKDARHSGLIIIEEKFVQKPYFDDWGMSFTEALDFNCLLQAMKG